MLKITTILGGVLLFGIACQSAAQPVTDLDGLPTQVATAAVEASPTLVESSEEAALPPTWTPAPIGLLVSTPFVSVEFTPRPTTTPWPTVTSTPTWTPEPSATPEPTATPEATATPLPTSTLSPVEGGQNLLPNPSFEEGWYHPNGEPELQIPNRWRLEFDEGENSLDQDPWNAWVRPEVRVLDPDFLPPQEHDLFIWDGRQTVKIFKGQGAISFRLLTDVQLSPGTYAFTVRVFPDLVESYTSGGGKVWAGDKLSGEVSLWTGALRQPWQLPAFGRRNTFQQTFTVEQAGIVTVGVAIRGRWAILNNGWFLDDWELRRVS